MIVQGVDSDTISRPLLVDAAGRAIVSLTHLTTTGGELLVDLSGRLMVGSHGWIGGAWQKQPIHKGHSSILAQVKSNLSAAAGANTLSADAVPAGEIWTVEGINAYDANNAITGVAINIATGSVEVSILNVGALGASVAAIWYGAITLAPGDVIKAYFSGCTVNDDIFLRYRGYITDIDQ